MRNDGRRDVALDHSKRHPRATAYWLDRTRRTHVESALYSAIRSRHETRRTAAVPGPGRRQPSTTATHRCRPRSRVPAGRLSAVGRCRAAQASARGTPLRGEIMPACADRGADRRPPRSTTLVSARESTSVSALRWVQRRPRRAAARSAAEGRRSAVPRRATPVLVRRRSHLLLDAQDQPPAFPAMKTQSRLSLVPRMSATASAPLNSTEVIALLRTSRSDSGIQHAAERYLAGLPDQLEVPQRR
jgi:hypothetical protein